MPISRGFFALLLALVAILTFAMPTGARAADSGVGGNANVCADGAVDSDFQKAVTAAGQRVSQDLTKAWSILPKIGVSSMYCAQKLISTFSSFVSGISGITDPLGVVINMLGPQILAMVNNACSQVMSAVNSIKNSISALTRICIPLPSFSMPSLNLGISTSQCSGGTPIQLIQGNSPWKSSGYSNGNSMIH